MCEKKEDGGRRCPGNSNQNRRAKDALKRHDTAQQADATYITALIGATPYRPESANLVAMGSRRSYYESDEWQEWSDRIRTTAERYNVTITSDHDREHSEGLWLGETEPSGAYTVTGEPDNINKWAAAIAGHYNQDAVMVLTPGGNDTLYTLTPTNPHHAVTAEAALEALKKAGIDGGRVNNGNLEIVSVGEKLSPETLELLRLRLNATSTDTPVTANFIEKDPAALAHTPIKEIQHIRQMHAEKHGLPVRGNVPNLTEQDDIAASLAYENTPHTPNDPAVARSYATLRKHIAEQYDELTAAGYTFEPWSGVNAQGEPQEQPYTDSADMMRDLRDNKHLSYFRTEVSQTTEGALPPDHPMAQDVTVHDKNGNEITMCANDAFRAVHDAIAHSEGHKFGPHGEKMAWWTHRSSLPREAHLALFDETRAQNVFTNAGPHMRKQNDDGTWSVKKKGDDGYIPITDRPYAEQKCAKVPLEIV